MGERTTIGDLTALAHKSRIPLVGVYNKDQLNGIPKNGLYIINMEDSDDGFGTHWVGLWISSNKCMRPIYFDSFGFQPPPAIVKFVKSISSRLLVNTKEIQDPLKGY